MKTQKNTGQGGFTLIETLMAMAIFTIGILGLLGMQTAVIKKNLTANSITSGATWAADRIELLLGQDYLRLQEKSPSNGCTGLNDRGKGLSDGEAHSGTVPEYHVYWNVANNCSLSTIPNAPAGAEDQEQKPKHIRVIVTVDRFGGERELAVYEYIKQNIKNN